MYRQDASPDRTLLITAFNGSLFAVDRASGEVRWQVLDIPGYGIFEIAIEDGIIIAVSDKSLAFVDYLTGRKIKVVAVEGTHTRRPTIVVEGGCVYIGRDGELACYTTQGELVWHQPFKGRGFGSMALGFPGNLRQADDPGVK